MTSSNRARLAFHPVTPDRWRDLVALFQGRGNPGYCWCTRWRLRNAEYRRRDSAGRRQALRALVTRQIPVGILAYRDGEPVGWCSVAPRETYALLESSTTLKRLDDQPVWSVVCFFVRREARGQGLALHLLQAAVKYALAQGARIVEGYPAEPDRSYRFMGSPSIFGRAGFRVVATAANGRPIVRYTAVQGGRSVKGGRA
jgi:GNAT superfamily N-acetyltransferase